MKHFIKALYADLLHRTDVVITDIKSMNPHDDVRDRFVDSTIAQLSAIRNLLQDALDTGVLEFEYLANNNLYRFNRANREFANIHSYRYLPLKHYDDPEVYFYRVISKVYDEHRISAKPPIVSTISNHDSYYWAVPYYEVIAFPAGEERSLLNLPDMYHEIGHLLDSMFKGKSSETSSAIIDKHFAKEIVRVKNEGLEQYVDSLTRAKFLWQRKWIEEFTCDLVGTYMTGAAYAWTNLKLLSTGHGSAIIYSDSDTHPADEARMTIIIMMLEKLGLKADKKKVEDDWNVFLKDTEPFKPGDYNLLYPKKLLQQIVDEFFVFYQNADLASYPELVKANPNSIAQLLNEAWEQARNNPLGYNSYEVDAVNNLRQSFGLKRL
ncbi:MAG: hypothetical protein U0U70_14300 [Chitinophagaceae bacterium]